MRSDALARRAEELAAQGAPFVTATVVRAQRPTSARAGNVALVLSDGTVDGFVGGVCAEHSVRMYALKTMQSGEPMLLRILPDEVEGGEGQDAAIKEDGAVTVQNPCLSGGAIEVFLEPVLPAPRVLVVGDTPIAGALERFGPDLGLDIVAAPDEAPVLEAGDLAVVVAAHGRGELEALRLALEANVPYVGLVASSKRGAALVEELREDGVAGELLDKLETPAGIEIGAVTPSEIALTILARVIEVRRSDAFVHVSPPTAPSPALATDPICGMTVPATPDSIHIEHDGETIYFCREGCKAQYEQEHGLAEAAPANPSAGKAAKPATEAPAMAVDPICGMTVAATPDTPHLESGGETVYFCCEGCKKKFEQEQAHAVPSS
ncbi:MAG: XdhC family protein [Solirubrobacteraceae bacterium]